MEFFAFPQLHTTFYWQNKKEEPFLWHICEMSSMKYKWPFIHYHALFFGHLVWPFSVVIHLLESSANFGAHCKVGCEYVHVCEKEGERERMDLLKAGVMVFLI